VLLCDVLPRAAVFAAILVGCAQPTELVGSVELVRYIRLILDCALPQFLWRVAWKKLRWPPCLAWMMVESASRQQIVQICNNHHLLGWYGRQYTTGCASGVSQCQMLWRSIATIDA
jgi:hypothetical protein